MRFLLRIGQLAAPAFALGLLFSCQAAPAGGAGVMPPPDPKPSPVTTRPWTEVLVSVSDIDRTAAFFTDIAGYEPLERGPVSAGDLAAWGLSAEASGEALVLRAPGAEHGFVRLVDYEVAGPRVPTRPGARAWDTGCYWSIMVRIKDMESVYNDAIAIGWWTETPITYLEFGQSQLHVVVFKGPDGIGVQGYERLTTPLPEGFADFERVSQPFNIMQMTRDRESARVLMEDVLGFDRFWYGPPYTDEEPTHMPLGIPRNLTTTIPYKAGIFYPVAGEYGRMEYIEIEGLDGRDHAARCDAPNLGILSVSYPVADLDTALETIIARGWAIEAGPYQVVRAPHGAIRAFRIKAPDGANIEFFEHL